MFSELQAPLLAHLLGTTLLASILWSLHARLRRHEFNRWWASAWTLTALFQAGFTTRFRSEIDLPQMAVMLITTVVGFLVIPALVFGAVSFRSPGRITKPLTVATIGGTIAFALICYFASLPWIDNPLTSLSIQHGPRTLALSCALVFSAFVFLQRAATTGSGAAMLTGLCCFAYAGIQGVYTASFAMQFFGMASGEPGGLLLPLMATLMPLNIVMTFGICLGQVLLVVDEHQRAERALVASVRHERLVTEENTALQSEILRRRQIEEELRSSEDRYRDLVENSEDLLATHDLEGRILSCNPALARTLGYAVEDILRMSVRDLLPNEARHEFDDYIATLRRDGSANGQAKVLTRRGERRRLAYRNTLRTEGVEVPIVRSTARDVTEQVRAERALRLSEEKFAVAFRSSPCGMALSTLPEGRFIDVNTAFEVQSGYTRAEVIGRTGLELGLWSNPDDRPLVLEEFKSTGRLRGRETPLRHRSGANLLIELSAETVTVGGQRCLLWAALDVTARREAEARHRAILRALPDWLFLTTRHGVFLQFQARDQRHLVMPPNEFIGRNIVDVLPPDLATRILNCFSEALASDQPATLDYSLMAGSEERFYEVRAVRSDGDHVLSLVRDVTDRKRAERRARELQDELMHTSRVMALGTLTGSLAHEINQPLTAIAANAHVAITALDAKAPDIGEIRAALGDIVRDNRRIDEVLRRLRLLLKKDRREYAPVDLNAIVNDVLGLVRSDLIQRRIRVDVMPGSQLPPVLGDRIQLQQVVLNIVMNAADAVSAERPDERYMKVSTALQDGQVVVSVTDRGAGVSDVALDQLFTPFYTTKPKGMGLGLSIARTIMEAHGGQIRVARNADRGLTCWFAIDSAGIAASAGVGAST
jgi:PAS domain S-box-containing protein